MDLNAAIWFFTYWVAGKPLRVTLEIIRAYAPKFLPELWNWLVWNLQRVGPIVPYN